MVSIGLTVLTGLLPITALACSAISIDGKSETMLLPFSSSTGPSVIKMPQFTSYHGNIPSGTLGSGSKFLVPIMRMQADQNMLLSIYRPATKPGDYVLMHPDDSNLAYASQLKSAAGNMGVEYFSLSGIEANAPTLGPKGVTFISYDLESIYSPSSDLANPVISMQTAAAVTHKYGLLFMSSPSRLLTDKYYYSFAKVSDIYQLQAQAFESNPSNYSTYVHNTIPKLKNAHPGMPVSVETSTARGTVFQMEQCFSLVADVVDGSSSWYTDDSAGYTALEQYLRWFVTNYR